MKFRTIFCVALVATMALLCSAPVGAAETLAFSQKQTVWVGSGGSAGWKQCASVTINVDGPGYVVVTASGMATFGSNTVLDLSLATQSAQFGPWQFWLTAAPPFTSYQAYNVRMVFKVGSAGAKTFFLNGKSVFGGAAMHVETGSMTAEFYPNASVQPPAAAPKGAQQDQKQLLNTEPRPTE